VSDKFSGIHGSGVGVGVSVAVGVTVEVPVGVDVGVSVQEAATVVCAIAVCVTVNPGWNTPQASSGKVHTINRQNNDFVFTMSPSLKTDMRMNKNLPLEFQPWNQLNYHFIGCVSQLGTEQAVALRLELLEV
jgi:hypothetical protein